MWFFDREFRAISKFQGTGQGCVNFVLMLFLFNSFLPSGMTILDELPILPTIYLRLFFIAVREPGTYVPIV